MLSKRPAPTSEANRVRKWASVLSIGQFVTKSDRESFGVGTLGVLRRT